MRILKNGAYSVEDIRKALLFLAKRLNATKATKALAPAIKGHANAVRAAADAAEDADLDVQASTAEIEVLNDDLAVAFRPLVLGLDTLVGGQADDPRRRRLFPKKPSDALQPTVGADQDTFVLGVLQVLAEDADFAALKEFAKPIAGARDALNAKIAERAGLMAKVSVADSNLAKTLVAACQAHNEAEPDVKKAVGASNKKKVESFFYKFPKAKTVTAAEQPA